MGNEERGLGMDQATEDTPSGVTRRDAIKKGAIVGGTVLWVAPLVQSVGMGSASAQQASPRPCICTGSNSFDVRATLSGLVNASVGPIQDFPNETGCLANASVRTAGAVNSFLTATADCVGGSTAGGTCSSFVELVGLDADLTAINAALNVQLDASVVRAEAACTCGGGCTARSCITQLAGQAILTIGGTRVLLGTGAAICGRQEFTINLTTVTGTTVRGTIVLNDTSTNPCRATVATIDATVTPLGGVSQRIVVVIGQATAVCG